MGCQVNSCKTGRLRGVRESWQDMENRPAREEQEGSPGRRLQLPRTVEGAWGTHGPEWCGGEGTPGGAAGLDHVAPHQPRVKACFILWVPKPLEGEAWRWQGLAYSK